MILKDPKIGQKISFVFLILLAFPGSGLSDAPSKCSESLKILSSQIQDFISCSIDHAVPVTFCLNCEESYESLLQAYNVLTTSVDEKNVSCSSLYFNLDRLGLVQRSYMSAVSLWTSGFCENCYEKPLEISNRTGEFLDSIEGFKTCTREKLDVGDVCQLCLDSYMSVNKAYEAIKGYDNDAVCFDLQDKINETRRFWSIDVKCNTNPDEKQIPFLIFSAAVTALPICFYVVMFAHTHHSESNEENMNFLNESTTEPVELDDNETVLHPSQPSINVGGGSSSGSGS